MFDGLGNIEFRRKSLPGKATIREVQDVVCARFRLTLADMQCSDKTYALSHPRQMAMHLCRELTGRSFPAIAREFGGRDHTTALFAHRKYAKRALENPEVGQTIAELRAQIVAVIRSRDPIGLAAEVAEANAILMCAA